ncbi:MAG: biotin--[acetyl-CoA-carboxylase] ligase [Oscillospiraceae bacterium]|nr:biotin--[acetyl-CoA-carboxylase] ligase [Oscillospiraceae bacterium]
MGTKEKVLEILEQNRNSSISGEQLAASLHISRNAIWKAVRNLREDGHQIISATNKGYCLQSSSDVLSVQGMRPYLSEDIMQYLPRIQIFQTLHSTNETAKELASAGAEHGTVIFTETQTGGHGRYARVFHSPPGGLYLSIVLRPEQLSFSHMTTVTAFAAVAVCQTIEELTGEQPRIKWVNDIYLHQKKVCGILTEAVTDLESGCLSWIVLGIGINLQTDCSLFPEELQDTVGSVLPFGNQSAIRNPFAAALLNHLLSPQSCVSESQLYQQYKSRMIIPKSDITVIQGQKQFSAKLLDIDNAGHLIVLDEAQNQHTLLSGEIQFPKPFE